MNSDAEMANCLFFSPRGIPPGYAAAILLAVVAGGFFLAPGPPRETAERLEFSEMYAGATSLGISFGDKPKRLAGRRVRMAGFMASPLKPTAAFFILTRVPMSVCPFCSSDADWPPDIVAVELGRPAAALPFDRPIWVEGVLEIGTKVDSETGFVSLVRIRAEEFGEDERP
ncbi:MAG: hypothetical protein LBU64_00540 [Planctomycetota bacterium]|jgi:hypothetical protein|nr:hypothetical protein [Planctomycetota bacterium]